MSRSIKKGPFVDKESMTRMNDEMQTVYAKYGFSPYGTCLPLAFQMILLIGVYQVIYHIPGYGLTYDRRP